MTAIDNRTGPAGMGIHTADPETVAAHLYPPRDLFDSLSPQKRAAARAEFAAQATEIPGNGPGERLGLAALTPRLTWPYPEIQGVVMVDGEPAAQHPEFAGYLDGQKCPPEFVGVLDGQKLAGSELELAATPDELRTWFVSQVGRFRDRDLWDVAMQFQFTDVLHQLGELPDDHHIGLTADGPLQVGHIPAWAAHHDRVVLSFGAGFAWNLREISLAHRTTSQPVNLPDGWLVHSPFSEFPYADDMFPPRRDPAYAAHQDDEGYTWQKHWWHVSGRTTGTIVRALCLAWECEPGDLLAPATERGFSDHATIGLTDGPAEFQVMQLDRPKGGAR